MRPSPSYAQVSLDTVRFTIVSTDSNVIQVDSAATVSGALGSGTSVVPKDQYYAYFKVRFVGSGTARVIVSAPAFGADTMAPVTVTGPVLAEPLAVSQTVSDPAVAAADSATRTMAAAQYYTTFAFRGLKSGSVNAIFTAPGYKADTMVVAVDTAQLSFGSVPTTVGPNQSAQVYVGLPFTNDLAVVVTLSTSPAGVLGVPSTITIPARAGTVYFNVTGLAAGTAHINGTAPIARSGASTDIVVGPPKLQLSLSSGTVVAQKTTLTVYAEDSLGAFRNVTTPLTVTLVSSDPTNTVFDSATIRIPVGNYYAQTGITFNQAGGYTITGTASGYAGANISSAASGALVQIQTGAPGVFVPQSVTINAGQYVTWKNVDAISHTTTEDTATLWNSGTLSAGTSYARYFGTPGTFTYHCAIHPSMTGTVVVNP